MRAFSCALAAAVLATSVAHAQTADPATPPAAAAPPATGAQASPPKPKPEPSRAERLDTLFAELRREGDVAKAKRIAERIQGVWSDSGSATVDLLMARAAQAASTKNEAAALDLLDQAIVLKPDYAESWNRRATLHYGANRYGASMRDVGEVLRLEPRHFGALMGLGAMLEETGRNRQALDAFARALAVYPAMKEAQDAVSRISDELAGQPA